MAKGSDIIGEIIRYLKVEKAMGTEWIPVRKKRDVSGRSNLSPMTAETARETQPISGCLVSSGPTGVAGKEVIAQSMASLPRISEPFSTRDEVKISEKSAALEEINATVKNCRRCVLHEHRMRTVFHDGHPAARLCFVGEGPGAEEDATGVPFVGKAGKLLTRIVEAIGLKRPEVYIANTVKCRPPGNRTPLREEMDTCWPYLEKQIRIVAPEVIVALGLPAAQVLLRGVGSISKYRGKWMEYNGIPLMPTYHPAYLLRNPEAKKLVWEDMKKVHAFLYRGKLEGETAGMGRTESNLSLFKKR